MSTISEPHSVDTTPDASTMRAQVAVVIPTLNAKRDWTPLSTGLRLQNLPPGQILIIDSSSEDGTRELASSEGYRVIRIDRRNFNHGATRQLAVELAPWASIVVYLTQDAVLTTSDTLDRLLAAFEDSDVAAAYGRQLPRLAAGPIEAHARLFHYPPESQVRNFESRHTLGIKAASLSNSFAAYRIAPLCEAGGFRSNAIMAEESLIAAKLLMAGWKVAYVAEAQACHSRPSTVLQEFRRHFDTGVYHRREAWLSEQFGKPSGEKTRFMLSELEFLAHRNPLLMPVAFVRAFAKGLGYKLGLREAKLGKRWSKRLSYRKDFWNTSA